VLGGATCGAAYAIGLIGAIGVISAWRTAVRPGSLWRLIASGSGARCSGPPD